MNSSFVWQLENEFEFTFIYQDNGHFTKTTNDIMEHFCNSMLFIMLKNENSNCGVNRMISIQCIIKRKKSTKNGNCILAHCLLINYNHWYYDKKREIKKERRSKNKTTRIKKHYDYFLNF